ncbi:MAG: hypothetical protein HPY61_08140 [Methanotrichaceae archaeon]|nr:hypothetical protein [Methanotrichaceae archaeon]
METLKVCMRLITEIVAIAMLSSAVSASEGDISELKSLILSFEDTKMTVEDLAFYLATHNYDARPVKDHVELKVDEKRYKLIPNGDAPGICDILPDS